jgi:hypothetical protein
MMKYLRLMVIVGLYTSQLGAGCGDDGTSSSSGSGGGGGGTSQAGTCDAVCDAMFAQDCFYAGGEADCLMSCNGWETDYAQPGPDYCQAAWDAYKSCMSTQTLDCNPDGNPDWAVTICREHWDHFNNYCINKNADPSTPCTQNSAFDAFCTSTPDTPTGNSCFGDVPAGCVIGGNENNSNLYCCP